MSEQVTEAVRSLLEQKPFKFQKPFPGKAVVTPKGLPAHGTQLTSRGEPWMIKLYAEDAPVPEEMFKVMDLHHEAADKPGFIGWIGGTVTTGRDDPDTKRTMLPTLFVEEAQSDLLQRTVEFTDPKTYQQTLRKRLMQTSGEYATASGELEKLKKEFVGSQALMPLNQRLRYEERIGELEGEMQRIFKDWEKEFKYPQFAQYKSKLENYYHKWTDAMFNAALELARQKGSAFLAILSADKIKSIWHGNLSGKDRSLFDRIYDRTAQRWNMERTGDWWAGRVEDIQPLEGLDAVVANLLGDEV